MKRPEIKFYYRGDIERGDLVKGYRWTRGYSPNSEEGFVTYPWMTKRECQRSAMRTGAKAVFVESPAA